MRPRPLLLAAAALAAATASSALAGTTAVALKVERAWARPAPAGLPSSAAYFTVRNTGNTADVLEAVASADARASLHENMSHGGMTMMMPAASIPVPAGGVVELKPGGLHVMLEALKRPLKPGDRMALMLTFKHAGKVPVTAEVRPTAP